MIARPAQILQPAGLAISQANVIVKYGEYTYWSYTPSSNDLVLVVVAFDSNNQEVKRWEVPGYRYTIDIGIDNQNKTVVFYMWQKVGVFENGSYPVSFTWEQLKIN
ncbi:MULTISPECIES: hypothetical protein [Brevibacillus]|uniref:hypothetical protein n=1 Tax=Brevibacillus TaxID=55080 RepID=UPI000270F43D|nr:MULTISPECIES: hypothetical protein [Brevibacillus]EJL31542.1 hypothetical protein PMI05_00667 [Brevibacillus sp. BC25]MBY0085572.1 hypothetical protein [Brevibacillus brevis]MCC8434877.1 hypothetical protein [Brevibacillus sp. M2.1A]MCE0450044.1 hypothetical protein [Brevibacillus sp. AF8]UKK97272.1 hypothetical protein FO446_07530 [Brevibacillus brevis]